MIADHACPLLYYARGYFARECQIRSRDREGAWQNLQAWAFVGRAAAGLPPGVWRFDGA
jgi:hypothetical protein